MQVKELKSEKEVKQKENRRLHWELFKLGEDNKNQARQLHELRQNLSDVAKLEDEKAALKRECNLKKILFLNFLIKVKYYLYVLIK
jgi:hypothetical protein